MNTFDFFFHKNMFLSSLCVTCRIFLLIWFIFAHKVVLVRLSLVLTSDYLFTFVQIVDGFSNRN